MARPSFAILGTVSLFGAALLSGCSFTNNDRLNEVRDDPSPNIETMSQRQEDIDNAMTVSIDENGRQFWEDMGRVWMVDRPSRLSKGPHLRP